LFQAPSNPRLLCAYESAPGVKKALTIAWCLQTHGLLACLNPSKEAFDWSPDGRNTTPLMRKQQPTQRRMLEN